MTRGRWSWTSRHGSYEGVVERVVQHRLYDLATAVRDHPGVRTVALPSLDNGMIDGGALLTRLSDARQAGWRPAAVDLEQAMLRLDLEGLEAETFEALSTPAGGQVATWIRAGGPAVPTTRPVRMLKWEFQQPSFGWQDEEPRPTYVWAAEVVPRASDAEPGPLWRMLHSWRPDPRGLAVGTGWGAAFPLWSWAAPHHREVVAAHLLRTLAHALADPSRAGDALVPLACADGPVGDAMLLALGCGMGAKHQATRSAAVDALLVLAARDQLDGERLGRLLGAMVTAGDLVTARLVDPLAQAAASGAAAETWAAVAGLLAAALVHDTPVAGLALLLSRAVDIAEEHRIRATVPGLDDMAARKGRSQQVVEARRLKAVLDRNRG